MTNASQIGQLQVLRPCLIKALPHYHQLLVDGLGKYGLLTLGRPSVRCHSTLRARSPVCGSTLRVSHVRNCLGLVSDLPSSRITSLLEGLEFIPPSSARTKGDIYVPATYTNTFFFDFPFDEIRTSSFFIYFHLNATTTDSPVNTCSPVFACCTYE